MDPKKLYAEEFSNDVLNNIFLQAITKRVSDIHFEPGPDQVLVRFRIDGLLYPVHKLDKNQQEELISRVKVMSSLNITEHHLPQDGNIEFVYQDHLYNIRISTMPTIHGEALVCRMHDRKDVLINLNELGFDNEQLATMKDLISNSSGIILATGPTGSGKTSFLYSMLNTVSRPEKNIITIEDPIEYRLANIRQTEINESFGLTFGKVMRAVVRQDPDIVMLGEIRDAETAQMAAQVSLIGTMVLSTFHTFDVPALIARLQELGISNSIIAQAIKGIVSMRLLRKICPACKTTYQPTEEEKALLGDLANVPLYKGKGCEACANLGYSGRTGIYEVVKFDKDIKSCILTEQVPSVVNDLLNRKQVKSLRASAMDKVLQGITTTEEMIRVLGLTVFKER